MLFLTSNSYISFEAIDLKVWILTASSLAKNCNIWIFHIFLYKPDQTNVIMLFLTSNISGPRQNAKKLVGRFCPINMRIIPANF